MKMTEKIPLFPIDFKQDVSITPDINKINDLIRKMLSSDSSGINSVIVEPPYTVINRDPLKQIAGRLIVMYQVVWVAEWDYE
jgi:hypothetical protein